MGVCTPHHTAQAQHCNHMPRLTPIQRSNSRRLRKNMTDAELALWQQLRLRQVHGLKFRRQYPIGPYIADFACLSIKLIIEVDGSQHADQKNADIQRDQNLHKAGFKVLRFWDTEVLQETESVMEFIWAVAQERTAL